MIAQMPEQRAVLRKLRGQATSDGAGVKLTRVIGTRLLDYLDPFLLLDEFRSDDPGDYIAGFPEHPHRGFETVTYMLAGRMRHRDNQGNEGLLQAGSIQWMTAGSGIVHSEMPEQEDGLMWGFQLWVNLPASQKMKAPGYQDIEPERVPLVRVGNNVEVRVLAGEFAGTRGPVEGVPVDPLYLDVTLRDGDAAIEIPVAATYNAFVYVFDGAISIGDSKSGLARGELTVLGEGDVLSVSTTEHGRFIVVAGKPLNEPVARHGPFVMNTPEEIRTAFDDFQSGRFVAR